MKGDFSRLSFNPADNYAGVLYQQGRVFLDTDGTSETQIENYLRETLARDAIGGHVAAVPANDADSFKIMHAQATTTDVTVTVKPGHAWVDGVPLTLAANGDVSLRATYLGPPAHTAVPTPDSIDAATRDAVILEVWQESFSGFQDPLNLIEPALGGVDTTERLKTCCALKLLRLEEGEDCTHIAGRLADDFSAKGRLTVTPAASTTISGDCPIDAGGGYSGFEHFLYRIEIAEPDVNGSPRFKWSQFNGGLVGRGDFAATGATTGTVNVKANNQMIRHCGLSSFYLEALRFDPAFGHWRVVFTADAALQDDTLSLTNVAGTWPASAPGTAFFRLWNAIRPIGDFPIPGGGAQPEPLQDGLHLAFDAATNGNYTPGDYWTFPVRASGAGVDAAWLAANWPNAARPQGIHYRRVPLGVVSWSAAPPVAVAAFTGRIEDCRRIFDPLTELRGCCIEVRPGEDLHRAVNKLIDAGGGCLCLLPGDHLLTRPIDLTRRHSIRIKGCGPASRLLLSSQIAAPAPFILNGAHDVTFEAFVIVNQSPLPVWRCAGTARLSVQGMFVLSLLEGRSQPLFELQGSCHGWRLEDSVFAAATGLLGNLLASSAILDNVWIGASRALDLKYAQELQIERNDFLGIRAELAKDLDTLLEGMATGALPMSSGKALSHDILTAPNAAVAPQYLAVELHTAFDVDIIDNEFYGSAGLYLEWTENSLVQRNRFRTLVAGTTCGVAHGLRFNENRIGITAEDRTAKPLTCETGLLIRGDIRECRIGQNLFANVKQGVVFDPDFGNGKSITRDFAANLRLAGGATAQTGPLMLADAETRANEVAGKNLLLNSSLFRVVRCERVIIEGNQFHAAQIGIEWSGTHQIFDFRIAGNAFIGCQDVAIQIEPDNRMLMLADPVDTKVRLIENNRFQVFSGAVRSTIGAVRVEKNDIRVDAPVAAFVPPKAVLGVAADSIYNSQLMAAAARTDDMPLVQMMSMEVASKVETVPATIDTAKLAADAKGKILADYPPLKGDALADNVYTLATLADLNANAYVGALSNALLPALTVSTAGFAINLAGIQNHAMNNRVHSTHAQRPGGVLFNMVSGEVCDNEIVVPGTAVLLNGKFGLSSGYRGARVVGNSLTSLGVPGSKLSTYALAIPSLSAGNLAVTGNLLRGSAMIGGDPLSAQGFSNPNVYVFPATFTYYNAMKYDMATYAEATLVNTFPVAPGGFGVFVPPGTVVWQTDPHANRPVVQFCQNRLIQGWMGVFQALSGAYWSAALLKSQASQALIANVANNVLDYGGSVVGSELIVMGNHSQAALKYRVGNRVQVVANIPAAVSF